MNDRQVGDDVVRECLLCGRSDEPTSEHIIPQALWRRFGIDPDRDDLARYRTTLCHSHNQATSALHRRPEMLDLIETGEPVTPKTLRHLADWAVWITLLLALARGSGVLGVDESRNLLLRRFDSDKAGTPKGMRVYAARVSEYIARDNGPSHALALYGDSRVLVDQEGSPIGFSVRTGPVNASESIGLGRVALLVVGRTHPSGPGHTDRLDSAAASLGLQRILPLSTDMPDLPPTGISMSEVGKLFTVIPGGADVSLFPASLRWPYAPDEQAEQGDE
jgi:hypothetical protein